MSDRDELAALIELNEFGYDTERRPPSAYGYALADAILSRWRLVPVERLPEAAPNRFVVHPGAAVAAGVG